MFDLRTLILLSGILLMCRGAVLLYIWEVQRRYPPTRDWAIGAFLCAIGAMLIGLRGMISPGFSVFLAQMLIIPGWLLTDIGIVRAAGARPPWRAGAGVAAVAVALIGYFLFVTPDFGWRTVVYTLAVMIFDLYAAGVCWRAGPGGGQSTLRVLAVLLVVFSLSNLIKLGFTLEAHIQTMMSDDPGFAQFFLITILYVFVSTPLFVLLAAQRLQEELNHEARHDTLTSAYNRRAMDELCAREWARSLRHDYPLSFLMLDIDHFKRFNDDYGHAMGDKALATVSQAAESMLRPEDLWFRYGGEEFVAMLPHADSLQAAEVAERLRAAIELLDIRAPQGRVRVTVSIGVAERQAGAEADWLAAVRAADQAMYSAKAAGRNRVRRFGEAG